MDKKNLNSTEKQVKKLAERSHAMNYNLETPNILIEQYNNAMSTLYEPLQRMAKQHQELLETAQINLSKIAPQIEQTNKLLENPLFDVINKQEELIKSATEPFKKMEAQMELIRNALSNPIVKMYEQIDLTNIAERMKQGLENIDKSLEVYENHLWAVDMELYEAIEEEKCELNTISSYIEESIDTYLQFFLSESYFEKYHLLIEQSIHAFKQKQYAIAAMPLFAIVDGNIVKAFEKYEIDDSKLTPRLQKNKKQIRIYAKVKDYVESEEDRLAYFFIFFKRVFKVYDTFFQPSWKEYPKEINRNYIMHGSYNYDEITKEDVLKLIQLVKATSVLQYVSFD